MKHFFKSRDVTNLFSARIQFLVKPQNGVQRHRVSGLGIVKTFQNLALNVAIVNRKLHLQNITFPTANMGIQKNNNLC